MTVFSIIDFASARLVLLHFASAILSGLLVGFVGGILHIFRFHSTACRRVVVRDAWVAFTYL